MTRLVVRNSVDVRMMAMQLNKLKNLDRVSSILTAEFHILHSLGPSANSDLGNA